MPAKITLKVTSGPMAGRSYVYDCHDTFLLGRRTHCHMQIDDIYVSRHHFVLEANPPHARLRDLGSLHGTYVNSIKFGGRDPRLPPPVSEREPSAVVDLKDGDTIRVGKTELQIKIEAANDRIASEQVSSNDANRHPGAMPQLAQAARGIWKWFRREDELGNYELCGELGRGAMGVVYKARHTGTGQHVAVKQIRSQLAINEKARRHFLREIRSMAALRHPNVVELLASNAGRNQVFILMEYCDQGSLENLMQSHGGTLSPATVVPILLQCLDALEFIHQAKYVHRDLKPSNVLICKDTYGSTVKIADLGLAKSFENAGYSGMTITGTAGGTPYFMPREQITQFKYVQPVSDLWSVAATAYHALTGRFPLEFSGRRDWIEVLLNDEPTPIREYLPGVPPGLARVLDRALLFDTERRYQSAADMKRDLHGLDCVHSG